MSLPDAPKVELEVVRDRTGSDDRAFLDVRRLDLVLAEPNGTRSAAFAYDVLDRRSLDACVMVAHHTIAGEPHIWLRSAVRPPAILRPKEPFVRGSIWEVPAGLIEPGEEPRAAAVRELAEELGFDVPDDAMEPLGPWSLPSPGFIGEVQHYFHVRVDPTTRREPDGDGSPLEVNALIVAVPLARALDACRRGEICDTKTELALRRLAELLCP